MERECFLQLHFLFGANILQVSEAALVFDTLEPGSYLSEKNVPASISVRN